MSNDTYWDQGVGVVEDEVVDRVDGPGAFIRVNGSNIAVEVGTDAVEVIKTEARNAGLGKFRVFMNGDEIKPSQASGVAVSEGDMMELRPYDVAG